MEQDGGLFSGAVGLGLAALVGGFALVALAKIFGLAFMRWKSPFRVGASMSGARAEVTEWSGNEGYVMAGGELWRAVSTDALQPGDDVTVAGVDGLLLNVRKKPAESAEPLRAAD